MRNRSAILWSSEQVGTLTLVEGVGEELLPEHLVEDTFRPLEQREHRVREEGKTQTATATAGAAVTTYQVSMTPDRKVDT